MNKLKGKVAIVTGASRGIGAEISRVFAEEGANVVCVARTKKEGDHLLEGSLELTCNQIVNSGGNATPVAANISVADECERLVNEARDIYGPIDILVNNAALTYFMPITEYPINRWMRTWFINVHAPLILSQFVLQDMIQNKSGSIVNISSKCAIGLGRGPYDGSYAHVGDTCYGSQKAALERMTQGLASEVYKYGIRVTCLSPSQVVPTPGTIHHRLVTGWDDPRSENPNLMAQAALLLASEPLDKISGRVTYTQQILKEHGLIADGRGTGVDPKEPGSGYSQI